VGTTDNDYEGPLDHVRPSSEDIDYLLEALNAFFGTSLAPANLAGAFAGVRPLISTGDSKKSVDISRKAELYETSSGMITITGGKLTTWRRMAKMTVDRLVERDARDAPCHTHEIPLGQAIAVEELSRVEGVPEASYPALASRYGHAAHDVLALAAERGELAQPIVAHSPDLLAEVALAARREQARSIGDVLFRRTRLALLAAREIAAEPLERGEADAAPLRRVGQTMARELGWDAERLARELERYSEEARREGVLGAPIDGAGRVGAERQPGAAPAHAASGERTR
jgi:glycerol-3-phosphate dehydrogenase